MKLSQQYSPLSTGILSMQILTLQSDFGAVRNMWPRAYNFRPARQLIVPLDLRFRKSSPARTYISLYFKSTIMPTVIEYSVHLGNSAQALG